MTCRILFLNHASVLGGAELSLLDIVRAYGDAATVLLFSDGPFRERLERIGARVQVLPASTRMLKVRRETGVPRPAAVLAAFALARRVAKIAMDYDVLYASSQKAFVVGAIAARLARRPLIWHLHDILTTEHFSRTHLALAVGLANRGALRVITNSEAARDAFIARGGRPDRIRVIYYGFDAAPFAAISAETACETRARLAPSHRCVVGIFSRLAAWKGQHVLVDALPSLPDVEAIIVGDALFGEQAYADAVRRRAEELGVAERVHFLGFRPDVPLLMRSVDIVLHTSTAPEPFGRVIVEGMLAGKPVIASRAGGAMEIVRDGVTGLLVRPGDAAELAAAIGRLARDARLRHRMAEAGREEAMRRFSLSAMHDGVSREIAGALA